MARHPPVDGREAARGEERRLDASWRPSSLLSWRVIWLIFGSFAWCGAQNRNSCRKAMTEVSRSTRSFSGLNLSKKFGMYVPSRG